MTRSLKLYSKIDRTTLINSVSYDINFTDNFPTEHITNYYCFSHVYGYSTGEMSIIKNIKVYLKIIVKKNRVLDYLEILNNITSGYEYNEEDHSIIFKPINKVHLKWSLVCIRFLWEPSTMSNKGYTTIVPNTIKLWKKYDIDPIDCILLGHCNVISANPNHGLFSEVNTYFLIDNKEFINMLNEPLKEGYFDIHKVLRNLQISSNFSTDSKKTMAKLAKEFKLKKKQNENIYSRQSKPLR